MVCVFMVWENQNQLYYRASLAVLPWQQSGTMYNVGYKYIALLCYSNVLWKSMR